MEADKDRKNLEELTEYLLNRIKDLEKENIALSSENKKLKDTYNQRIKWLEERIRAIEYEKIRLQRELRKLRNEIERLRSMPLLVGTLIEVIDDHRAIVRSSAGPQFVVNVSQFVRKKDLIPGSRVALNQQSLAILEVLPSHKDPAVLTMEIEEKPNVTYSDIGGLKEQIREIREIVELPLKNPKLFEKVGIDPPKGVLLYGPPGTGKTLLARAVARESNAVFIKLVGSELVRKYIGEGARLVRELFALAREKAPSIIFIDELDAIGAKRVDSLTSGDREVQRTLMQLLAEMDGFDPRGDVKIIAATNRPDMLDPALLRPGRFDRLIEIPLPDHEARIEIFKIHTRKMNLDKDVDMEYLASRTEGASGADIKAICTEAGMFAIRDRRDIVKLIDFEKAIEKVMKKLEMKSKGKEPVEMYT